MHDWGRISALYIGRGLAMKGRSIRELWEKFPK
jgi:hypothetical protein